MTLQLTNSALRHPTGDSLCVLAAQAAVNDMEHEIHRLIFRDSPDFISFCRIDGTYIDVNPAFERFVGLPRENIIGRTPLEIGLWGHVQERQAFIDEVRKEGRLSGYHRRLSRSNGEVRDIEGWASIVELGGEEVLVAMGRDITERKRDEEELRQYRDRLEHLVERRTGELSEANQRLQTANKAKSTFMANMSHELRTPLNAILGYAQLLKLGDGLSERQLAGLATIEQGGQHLLALINDILDLARVEANKLGLEPVPVDVAACLGAVVDIMRVRAEQKLLEFRYEETQPLPRTVLADERRLRQILLNLLGNAVKFTDKGHVSLRVVAESGETDALLRFEIADTGVGIRAEDLAHLFSPFEQVGDARRRCGGAGLGLSISQALARMMGSEIQACSELGRGSRFSFALRVPLVEASMPVIDSAYAIAGYKGPRRRILIVDDIAANRDVLSDGLRMLGFDTACVADGLEALRQVERKRPDLILMDMVMPQMDGLEASRRLRAMPSTSDLPIIAISATASHASASECLSAGASAYLSKPIILTRLLERIGALLDLTWTH